MKAKALVTSLLENTFNPKHNLKIGLKSFGQSPFNANKNCVERAFFMLRIFF